MTDQPNINDAGKEAAPPADLSGWQVLGPTRFADHPKTLDVTLETPASHVLIWIKELRHPLVVLGILLHLGIDYALNLQLFGCLMIVCLLLFVDPQFILRVLGS